MTTSLTHPSIRFSRARLDPGPGFTLILPDRRGDPSGSSVGADATGESRLKETSMTGAKDAMDATPEILMSLLQAVAQRRDREAFARLHAYFAPRLASWLTRSGLGAVQAEDIVQETMVSVWRKAGLYNPALSGASTWVFVIARNLRTDFQRRKANHMAPLEDWDQVDESPTGEERLLTAEREEKLRKALAKLSREQAQVLEQAYFAEKPQSAIARELGVPLGTVKSRVRLALARLKMLLEEAL